MDERLERDVLPDGGPLEVRRLDGLRVPPGAGRAPHRHDYHEVLWVAAGDGHHLIDGGHVPVRPGTLTLIGRGQVHVFEHAAGVTGAAIRFGDDMLPVGDARRATPAWLLAGRGGRVVQVPAGAVPRIEALIDALGDESARPPDRHSMDIERTLVATLLHWAERWYDDTRTEAPAPDDAAVQLHRRFAALLERDYARRHDAAHYADTLGVPPATLTRTLTATTGRSTKEHVTDRVMVEASRLLRFTDLSVGEVSHAVGYANPLYFSRAFTRHAGMPPTAFRSRARGGVGTDSG